jgi:hypothetical protein
MAQLPDDAFSTLGCFSLLVNSTGHDADDERSPVAPDLVSDITEWLSSAVG